MCCVEMGASTANEAKVQMISKFDYQNKNFASLSNNFPESLN